MKIRTVTILMNLVSVERALKELRNDSHFVRLCLTLSCKQSTGTSILRYCKVKFTSYSNSTKQFGGKMGIIL